MHSVQTDENKFEEIASGIAERGFAFTDHFFTDIEIDLLRETLISYKSEGELKLAGIGQKHEFAIDKSIRGDLIRWIDPAQAKIPTQLFLQKVSELMLYLNQTLFTALKDFETHFTCYPPGTVYKRHFDQFRNRDRRKISFILYLNHQWETTQGGELRLYHEQDEIEISTDLLPIAGRFAAFRSDIIPHEVLPATRDRYSITGWMLDQLVELKHL